MKKISKQLTFVYVLLVAIALAIVLLYELDVLIEHLTQYREAMAKDDSETLCRLLDEGRRIKEEVDGK